MGPGHKNPGVSRRERFRMHRVYNSALSGWLIMLAVSAASAQTSESGRLWTGPNLPLSVKDLPLIDSTTYVKVHQAIPGGDQFLLGAAIIEHNGVFYANWANSPRDENSNAERVCGKRSTDRGRTWSALEIVAPARPGELAHSHGAYLSHAGKLWFFALQFEYSALGRRVNTEAFLLNEKAGRWESRGIVAAGGGMVGAPVRMKDGNWIVGGAYTGFWACAFISHGDDFTRWDRVSIPVSKGNKCSETAIIVDDEQLTAIMRSSFTGVAGVSISKDFGRSWTTAQASNFPMIDSKPFGGVLSSGQRYLVANVSNGNPNDRDTLVLAVSRPGERGFSNMWKIRQGRTPQPLFEGEHKVPGWQYPYAYEHQGELYVIYSVGKEDCELAIIPTSKLTAGESPSWTVPETGRPFQAEESAIPGLIAYEGFEYNEKGTVSGHPDINEPEGAGFYEKWRNLRNRVELSVDNASLSFPPGTSFRPAGRRVGAIGADGQSAKAHRVLAGTGLNFDIDGVFYVSALVQKADGGVGRGEYLQILFYADGGRTPFWMGLGSEEQIQMGSFGATTNIFSGPVVGAQKTAFLVAKIITNKTGNDQIFLKVFGEKETITAEPDDWNISKTLPLSGIARSVLLAFGPNSFGEVDELRIGSTWQAVTGVEP